MLREVKVGLLVITAFVVLGLGVFLVSERRNLFTLKNSYSIQFETVAGLGQGSPVQLDGVGVGSIQRIVLPEQVEQKMLTIFVTADRRYAERIREDSLARIKTLGLLGDKYIDISSGTTNTAVIPAGGTIPAAPPTDVERLIATGGNAVDNVVAISYSLRNILDRMEAGEGILGELTDDDSTSKRAIDTLLEVLESTRRITEQIQSGDGPLARLVNDKALMMKIEGSVDHLDAVLIELREGSGALPALIHDPATRERLELLLSGLDQATADLSALIGAIGTGDGLLGKMISDEDYADQLTDELQRLLHNLKVVSERIADSEGTLGLLISDPQVYEAINDIIVGVDESSMLRWLVRNRQKKGIEKRYDAEQNQLETEAAPATDQSTTGGAN